MLVQAMPLQEGWRQMRCICGFEFKLYAYSELQRHFWIGQDECRNAWLRENEWSGL